MIKSCDSRLQFQHTPRTCYGPGWLRMVSVFFWGFPWRISISKPIMTLNSHNSPDILEHVGVCRIASMNLLCLRWHTSDHLRRCGTGLFEHRIARWVLECFGSSPMLTNAMSSWESCWLEAKNWRLKLAKRSDRRKINDLDEDTSHRMFQLHRIKSH